MYCVLADIIKELPEQRVIELTDDGGTGAVNIVLVNDAIETADGIINAYCGGRYTVPIASPPQLIKNLSVSIAIYHLYKRRGRISDIIKDQYDRDIKLLESISRGVVTLGVQPPPADSPVDVAACADVDDPGRVFRKDSLGNF